MTVKVFKINMTIPIGTADISWQKQKDLEQIQNNARKKAKEAVAIAKKLGWNPNKNK